MRQVLIATHSHLADGFLSSCRYFLPSVENITVHCAYEPDSPDTNKFIQEYFARQKEEDEVLVFTDILFGSLNQAVMQYVNRPHTHILTGTNLPLLLEVLTKPDNHYLTDEELAGYVESSKTGLIYMNTYHHESSEEDE